MSSYYAGRHPHKNFGKPAYAADNFPAGTIWTFKDDTELIQVKATWQGRGSGYPWFRPIRLSDYDRKEWNEHSLHGGLKWCFLWNQCDLRTITLPDGAIIDCDTDPVIEVWKVDVQRVGAGYGDAGFEGSLEMCKEWVANRSDNPDHIVPECDVKTVIGERFYTIKEWTY